MVLTATTSNVGRRWAVLKGVAPLLLLLLPLVLYVVSYPFFLGPVVTPQNASHLLYKPVEWMIDNTPLMTPMRAWARIWDRDDRLELHYLMRRANLRRAPGEVSFETYSR